MDSDQPNEGNSPKVFISYSWSSPRHQAMVKQWAEQMIADGIEVVMDIYDLKEGHDKYVFMERMVADPTVTHVLVVSDRTYAAKADARKAGVGTESQIISKEVYEKVEQSKFIPIVCEFDADGNPCLPIFLKARIWIDFSSSEAINRNWEQLIRLLYGKPFHEKPTLGKAPVYIRENSAAPPSAAHLKFAALNQALLHGRRGVNTYRRDFFDACIDFADALRVRERPQIEKLGEKVLADCTQLKRVRNHFVDWVLLEGGEATAEFPDILTELLERLGHLKARPPEINSWNDTWFEAHRLFVYETFLYSVAALLKVGAYSVLREVFTTHYLLPETEVNGEERFESFGTFWGHSETLNNVLAPPGQKFHSAAGELIKRQADREDIPFSSVMEAELLVLLMSFLIGNTEWYPHTLHYASHAGGFPLFLRATRHKHFQRLATITGVNDADELRRSIQKAHDRLRNHQWSGYRFNTSFSRQMNLEKLDTLT
jgi:hypothetical protein